MRRRKVYYCPHCRTRLRPFYAVRLRCEGCGAVLERSARDTFPSGEEFLRAGRSLPRVLADGPAEGGKRRRVIRKGEFPGQHIED